MIPLLTIRANGQVDIQDFTRYASKRRLQMPSKKLLIDVQKIDVQARLLPRLSVRCVRRKY